MVYQYRKTPEPDALLFWLRRANNFQDGIGEHSLRQTAAPFPAQLDILRVHVVLLLVPSFTTPLMPAGSVEFG